MSRKTTTELMRRAKTIERKNEIMVQWMTDWRAEQLQLCDDFDFAADIKDFDVLCKAVGSLRAITEKKVDVLIRCLPMLTGNENICSQNSPIYQWIKSQQRLIGKAGVVVAAQDFEESKKLSAEFAKSNEYGFGLLADIIPFIE